jgi:hypothetical protein
VAFLEISGGAAVIAFAILFESVIFGAAGALFSGAVVPGLLVPAVCPGCATCVCRVIRTTGIETAIVNNNYVTRDMTTSFVLQTFRLEIQLYVLMEGQPVAIKRSSRPRREKAVTPRG